MNAVYSVLDALLPFDMFSYAFMKNALLALLLLTPMLALLGTMAVNRRMAFFSDALGHSALTGVGLAMLLGVTALVPVLVGFGVLWALLISRINRVSGSSADTNISVFSSTGIALGLVLLARDGKFSRYSSLLIGDVLAVTRGDLPVLLITLVLFFALWALLYNRLLLTAVNPPLAHSRGIPTNLAEDAFVCMVAVAVMLSIRWVGVLLINALLILPAAAARNVARTVPMHALLSVAFAVLSGVGGLVLAYHMATSVGAAVVLCAASIYALTVLARKALRRADAA